MRRTPLLPRILAALLSLSLAVPQSAYALRQTGVEESRSTKDKLVTALTSPSVSTPSAQISSSNPMYLAPVTSAAGLEESKKPLHLSSGELDEIGKKVLPLIIKDRLLRRERARRIGWEKQKRRIDAEKDRPAPGKETSPVLKIDPIHWDNFIDGNVERLLREGLLRIPIEGGEAVLLLRRESGQRLMLDLLLRPDPGAFVWAGKIDLFMSASGLRYVAKGAALGTRFSPSAEWFLGAHKIPDSGDSNPFAENRMNNSRRALLVNGNNVRRLSLSDKQIESLILLSAVEILVQIRPRYKDLGVDDTFDNQNLISREFSRAPGSPPGIPLIAQFNKLKPALIRRLYLSSAAGLEEAAAEKALNSPDIQEQLGKAGFVSVEGGFLARPSLFGNEGRLFLQAGLEEPRGMPKDVPVFWADEATAVGMLGYVKKMGIGSQDSFLFNGKTFTLTQAMAVLPLPMPASAILDPRVRPTASEIAAILHISRQTGTIYVVRITRLTFGESQEPLLFIQVQA